MKIDELLGIKSTPLSKPQTSSKKTYTNWDELVKGSGGEYDEVVNTAKLLKTDPDSVIVGEAPSTKAKVELPTIITSPKDAPSGSFGVQSSKITAEMPKTKTYVSQQVYDAAVKLNEKNDKQKAEANAEKRKNNFMNKAAQLVVDEIGSREILTQAKWDEILNKNFFETYNGERFGAMASEFNITWKDLQPYVEAIRNNTTYSPKMPEDRTRIIPDKNTEKTESDYSVSSGLLSSGAKTSSKKSTVANVGKSVVPNFEEGLEQLFNTPEFVSPNGQKYYNQYAFQQSAKTGKKADIENSVAEKLDGDALAIKTVTDFSKKTLNQDSAKPYKLDADIHNIVNGNKTVSVRDENYKFSKLDEKEKIIYNYLAMNQPKNSDRSLAGEYLNLLIPELEERAAVDIAEEMGEVEKAVYLAGQGFGNAVESIAKAPGRIMGGGNTALDQEIMWGQDKGELLSSAIIRNEDNAFYKIVYSTIHGIAQQVPALALGYATGGVGYSAALSAGVISESAAESIRNNKTLIQGVSYGVVQAAIEIGLERVLGGVGGKFLGKGSNSKVVKLLNKIDDVIGSKIPNVVLKSAVKRLEEGAGEALQEFIQALVDPAIRNAIYQENNTYSTETLTEALYQGLIGGIIGFALGGGAESAQTQSKYEMIGENLNAKDVISLAEQSGNVDSELYKQIQKLESKGKKIPNELIGRLSEETTQKMYSDSLFTVETLNYIAKNGTEQTIAETMFDGNLEAAKTFKEKYSDESFVKSLEFNTIEKENIETSYLENTAKQNLEAQSPADVETNGIDTAETSNEQNEFLEETVLDGAQTAEAPPTAGKILEMTPVSAKAKEYVKGIAEKLGVKMQFVNMAEELSKRDGKFENLVIYPEGFYDRETKTLYIGNNVANPVQFVFKHELTHHGENSALYEDFAKAVRDSKAFKKWVNTQGNFGTKNTPLAEARLKELYRQRYKGVQELTDPKAQREIIANFVADMLFKGDVEGLSRLLDECTTTQKNAILRYISDFFSWLKSKFTGDPYISSEIRDLENKFKELIGDVNTVTESETEQENTSFLMPSETVENKKTTTDESNGLNGYTEQQLKNWEASKNIVVYRDEKQLRQFIKDALENKNLSKKMYFGAISKELSKRIKKETGIDVEKYNCTLRASEIKKIVKDHGTEETESLRGQRPITEDDFVSIPEIVKNPDTIELSDDLFEGKPVIIFTKTINGKTTVSAYVSTKHLDLTVQTMFSGKNKRNLAIAADEQASANTPEANDVTVPKLSLYKTPQNVKQKSSKQNDVKQKQLEIIKNTNPMWDDYHTGIRTVDDIRTWEEVLELNDEREGQFVWGDFSREDAEQALKDGTITVYSSYPIKNGVFVSTSYVQAQEYAGGKAGKVYSKTIPLTDVAWINGDEGQYAAVDNLSFSVPEGQGKATETTKETTAEKESTIDKNSLYRKVQSGEMSFAEFTEKLNQLTEEKRKQYGTTPDGEMVTENNKPVNLPKKVAPNKNVRRFVRTILEANYNNEVSQAIKAETLAKTKGTVYEPVSNKDRVANARMKLARKGYNNAKNDWMGNTDKVTPDKIVEGEALLVMAEQENRVEDAVEIAAELAIMTTTAAQGLQTARLLKRMGSIGKLVYIQRFVNKLNRDLKMRNKNAPTITVNETLAGQLLETKTEAEAENVIEAIKADIAEQTPVTFLEKWNAWRYMAMLVNPTTHIRNLLGNAIFKPAVALKEFISATVQSVVGNKQKSTTFKADKKTKDFALKDFAKNKKWLASTGKYDDLIDMSEYRTIFTSKLAKPLEYLRKKNGELLEAEDAIFLKNHYVRSLSRYLTANKINPETASETELQKARDYAAKQAWKNTYRDASKFADMLSGLAKKNKFADIAINGVLPFKRTPINILKRGIEYSPIGFISSLTKGIKDLRSKKITVGEFIDGLSANASGTILFALGALLSYWGVAVGGFDDEDEWFRKLNGEQEYSINIGGYSYTVDWMAPSSIPFFMGVAASELQGEEDTNWFDNLLTMATDGLEPMIELSMLQGVNDVLENVSYAQDKDKIGTAVESTLTSYFSQAIPTVGGKIANLIDDTRRTKYIDKSNGKSVKLQTWFDMIAKKIPGVSMNRATYVDAWGQEEYTGNAVERFFQQFVSPGYASTVEVTPISEELTEIKEKTGNAGVYPDAPNKYLTVGGVRRDLSKEEYYDVATFAGQTKMELVNDAINHKKWDKLTDEQKASVISNIYKYSNKLAYASQLEFTLDEVKAKLKDDDDNITEKKWNKLSNKQKNYIIYDAFMDGVKKAYKYEQEGGSAAEYYILYELDKD